MKRTMIALFALCACAAFAQTRVDLSALVSKDFSGTPSLDQAARALEADSPFLGFGWEVVMGHIGIGGSYAVDFNENPPKTWWLDWEAQAIYASYHILGTRSFLDPFVDAGLGCAGRVYLGPGPYAEDRLALTLYPFVSAGAALILEGLRVGAKLGYALDRSAIPATEIAAYPLGRFQAQVFAGFSIDGPRLLRPTVVRRYDRAGVDAPACLSKPAPYLKSRTIAPSQDSGGECMKPSQRSIKSRQMGSSTPAWTMALK